MTAGVTAAGAAVPVAPRAERYAVRGCTRSDGSGTTRGARLFIPVSVSVAAPLRVALLVVESMAVLAAALVAVLAEVPVAMLVAGRPAAGAEEEEKAECQGGDAPVATSCVRDTSSPATALGSLSRHTLPVVVSIVLPVVVPAAVADVVGSANAACGKARWWTQACQARRAACAGSLCAAGEAKAANERCSEDSASVMGTNARSIARAMRWRTPWRTP